MFVGVWRQKGGRVDRGHCLYVVWYVFHKLMIQSHSVGQVILCRPGFVRTSHTKVSSKV